LLSSRKSGGAMEALSRRLGRVDAARPGQSLATAGQVAAGAAVGAVVSGIPLLSSKEDWDAWILPAYLAVLVLLAVAAAAFLYAARSVRQARVESIGAIKEDLDALLEVYRFDPVPTDEPATDLARAVLLDVRGEAQDNKRILERCIEMKRFWRLSEPGPNTKAIETAQTVLYEPKFDDLREAMRVAYQEVDRIRTAASFRMFKRGRPLRSEDRVQDAIGALTAVETLAEPLLSDLR
jgi:hypothetical protein